MKPTISQYNVSLSVDYTQIFVCDNKSIDSFFPEWNPDEMNSRVACDKYSIVIGTLRNGQINFNLSIVDSEPIIDLSSYDHAVKCSISNKSGILSFFSTSDYIGHISNIKIKKGIYNAYILFLNLDSVSKDGLSGQDNYSVILWKNDNYVEKKVVKALR